LLRRCFRRLSRSDFGLVDEGRDRVHYCCMARRNSSVGYPASCCAGAGYRSLTPSVGSWPARRSLSTFTRCGAGPDRHPGHPSSAGTRSKWLESGLSTERRRPRPSRTKSAMEGLIVRMALENPRWGCARTRVALSNTGHQVGRGTIRCRDTGRSPCNCALLPRRGITFFRRSRLTS
jgi:hypothetical protein